MDSLQRQTHEYIREGSDYDKVMANLQLLNVAKTRVLLSFTLMKSNIDEYQAMASFCKEHGYSMSAFPLIVREENSIIPYNLLDESLWFNLDRLKTWLKDYYGKDYEGVVTGAAPGTTNLGINEFSCNAHNEDFGIDGFGNATLCFKLATGSLYRQSLEELWNCAEAAQFRKTVELDRAPCVDCDYRKRCLAPSMARIENHFGDSICSALSTECRNAIDYDRAISDAEARSLFIEDVGKKFGIFKIEVAGAKLIARRQTFGHSENAAVTQEKSYLEANTRHELHQLMVETTGSEFNVRLLEQYGAYNLVAYLGQIWAFPLALGFLNPTREEDRKKPGVLWAKSLAEIKQKCDESTDDLTPILVGSEGLYNIVKYLKKYWAVPLSLGPVFLNIEQERQRPGILYSETQEELLRRIRPGAFPAHERTLSLFNEKARADSGPIAGNRTKITGLECKMLLRLTLKQLRVKAAQSNRRGKTWKHLLKNAYYFFQCMWRVNSYTAEKTKHCLNELANKGIKEVAVYGADEIAEILNDLSRETSVKIQAIYDDYERIGTAESQVRPIEQYQGTPNKLIVGSIVGVEKKLEKLKKLGIASENIITLG